jgi:F0F1-type ATP synthase epsilon subunit
VHEDKVIILADDAVASSQIDVERARQAAGLAQQRLAEIKAGALSAEAAEEMSRIEADMTWAEVQVKVASAHR